MLRLKEPLHTFSESIDDCGEGIASYMPLKAKVADGKAQLLLAGDAYSAEARAGSLFSIAPFLGASGDVVLAGMTKGEFLKVYEQYFVPEGKAGRRIYDSIMNAAQEKCPFCGGIGTPRNLDHFLPKAFFPQFAVLPLNLVPACRDCNMDGKGSDVATVAEEQPIQPYLDDPKFFDEQWVFATYHPAVGAGPGQFTYFASPPAHWPTRDRLRVVRHFERFELAKRYSVRAAEHLVVVLGQIQRVRQLGLGDADVRHVVLQPGVDGAPFLNHWHTGMYQALM